MSHAFECGAWLIAGADPAAMMQAGGLAGDPVLEEVGGEAEKRPKRVAAALTN